VFAGHVWLLIQTDDSILYKSFCAEHCGGSQLAAAAANNDVVSCDMKSIAGADCEKCVDHSKLLHDYFQLSVNLQEMYKDWTQRGRCIFCCYFYLPSVTLTGVLGVTLNCLGMIYCTIYCSCLVNFNG